MGESVLSADGDRGEVGAPVPLADEATIRKCLLRYCLQTQGIVSISLPQIALRQKKKKKKKNVEAFCEE